MLARPRGRQACPPRSFAAPSEENPVAPVPIIDRDREGPPPSLEPLFRLLSGDLDRVNALIVDRMDSPVALIPQLAGHIVSAGGKRLRPMRSEEGRVGKGGVGEGEGVGWRVDGGVL